MNGKKHIETHFLKFLLDKYSNEELPQQEDEEEDEPESEIRRKLIQKLDQIEDTPPDEESDDIVDCTSSNQCALFHLLTKDVPLI